MSLIKCGTDENGSYIELKRPRGETPLCFIDECGVVHDTIRIYEYKAVRSKEIPTDSRCVMCGEIIPEGSMVCDRCREAVETEIPLSNLNSYQRVQFKQVGGSYTERGEFDL